jgi:hypothetical protein
MSEQSEPTVGNYRRGLEIMARLWGQEVANAMLMFWRSVHQELRTARRGPQSSRIYPILVASVTPLVTTPWLRSAFESLPGVQDHWCDPWPAARTAVAHTSESRGCTA